ncbi:MAG: hypothetical protein ACJAVO_002803 [Parvibaculaceae bacterium]|jgi:hypothetical protein
MEEHTALLFRINISRFSKMSYFEVGKAIGSAKAGHQSAPIN